jgi:hypothetical protein
MVVEMMVLSTIRVTPLWFLLAFGRLAMNNQESQDYPARVTVKMSRRWWRVKNHGNLYCHSMRQGREP